MESSPDLNLLLALDALLAEQSVTRAAQRLHLSPPAMSRTLTRIREAVGDPVLVRAGRGLVATPRALAMRERVRLLVEEAARLLGPDAALSPRQFQRDFALRTSDAVVPVLGHTLLTQLAEEAPGIRLRFVAEGDEDVEDLRSGRVDLDVGVQGPLGPEVRVQALFEDRMVVLVRRGSRLARGKLTVERFAAAHHIVTSRRGIARGPVDEQLAKHGHTRSVQAVVASHLAAAALVAQTDAITITVSSFAHAVARLFEVREREVPLPLPRASIAQAWHPRFDSDPAHAYVRKRIFAIARRLGSA